MKKPELLAPAGSFAAACQAFDAGADGIYLGLTEFSARKAAVNFTREQLRRICSLARQRDRRIYVAANTVIREDELGRLADSFAWLEALAVDGVIVQDLGALQLLRRGFPRLPVHASTQMAVHNHAGLRFAREQGIRRVILSRELPFEKIRDLRANHPDIELEVFIHGALCYSFSGICLASWALTGRSGNRGDCAQICRSIFCPADGGGRGEHGTNPFSCRDLWLGREVLKLAEIGIDALKIEGRMKSPEYVYHVTRMYREILDKGESLSDRDQEGLGRNVEVVFSREKTRGYFRSPRGEKLLTSRYPGHQGVELGNVSEVRGREVGLILRQRLSLHDGIGYWPQGAAEPSVFAVQGITREGRAIRFAEPRQKVFVPVPAGVDVPSRGAEMRLFSSRFLDRPERKETRVPQYRFATTLEVVLRAEPGSLVLACAAGEGPGRLELSLPRVPSTGRKSFEAVLRDLLEGAGGAYVLLQNVGIMNQTGLEDDDIFVPPSELKAARKRILAALDSGFFRSLDEKARSALGACPVMGPARAELPRLDVSKLSNRDLLSPPAGKPVPFASLPAGLEDLATFGGIVFVPLPPVLLDADAWTAALDALCARHPDVRFALGLANVGHLDLAGRLSSRENCFFFIDYYLYAANRLAVSFLTEKVGRLLFIFRWIEADEVSRVTFKPAPSPSIPVIEIDPKYRPPLFYSLGCYERHARRGGSCREGCPQDFRYSVRQGKNRFRVVVRDCVTYLFLEEGADASRV